MIGPRWLNRVGKDAQEDGPRVGVMLRKRYGALWEEKGDVIKLIEIARFDRGNGLATLPILNDFFSF